MDHAQSKIRVTENPSDSIAVHNVSEKKSGDLARFGKLNRLKPVRSEAGSIGQRTKIYVYNSSQMQGRSFERKYMRLMDGSIENLYSRKSI